MDITRFNLAACNHLLRLRRERRISWRAFGLGLAITSFVNRDTGEAWPSRAMLSAITGIDKADVSNTARELRDAGFLTIDERPGRSTIYRLTHRHLATGGDFPPVGVSPPTRRQNTPKPVGVSPPIIIEEQSNNNDHTHDDEKPLSPEAETSPAIDAKSPEAEPSPPASKSKAKATKVTPKKQYPGDLNTDAEKLVNLYAELVKPKRDDASGSRKIFLGTAKRLLAEGKPSSDMELAIRNYATSRVRLEGQEKDPEAARKYRWGFQTFFGPKNEHWKDYAMELPDEPADEYVDDYNDPKLVAMILEGIERERQGLEVI